MVPAARDHFSYLYFMCNASTISVMMNAYVTVYNSDRNMHYVLNRVCVIVAPVTLLVVETFYFYSEGECSNSCIVN